MGMNEAEIAAVCQDLQDLVGAALSEVRQPARDRLVLTLGSTHLLIVPRGPLARIHPVRTRPRNPKKPFSFQGACRAHLTGRLDEVRKVEGDRIIELHFGETRLHLRLTGRGGGLWLCRRDDVLAAYDGPAPDQLPALPTGDARPSSPRFEPQPGETWAQAADRHFTALERHQQTEATRAEVRRRLKRHLDKTWRLGRALERDLDKAERAPQIRRQADALAAHLHNVPRGQDHVVLPDLEDASQRLTIPLDPAKPPAASMERLYAKARRLDRMGERVLEQLEAADQRAATLRDALEQVETANLNELNELSKLAPADKHRRTSSSPQVPWHTWVGPAGQRVLVGKNAKGNRRLSFQVARGDDYWMHLRGRPGAHIILPMKRGQTPSLELLMAAGQIALIAAGVPEGASGDVQYTRSRMVKSIPGDTSGKVLVHDEKVLHITREPAGLVGWIKE